MSLGQILNVNPQQLAPAQTALACSLSYRAEQDVAEAEMIDFFSSFTRWILPDEQHSFSQTTNKNQTETDISIRANEKSVSNHWPEPSTNLQWSPGWLPPWDGCLVGQKMAAKGPVPARSRGCTAACGRQGAALRSGTHYKLLPRRSKVTPAMETWWKRIACDRRLKYCFKKLFVSCFSVTIKTKHSFTAFWNAIMRRKCTYYVYLFFRSII